LVGADFARVLHQADRVGAKPALTGILFARNLLISAGGGDSDSKLRFTLHFTFFGNLTNEQLSLESFFGS
jgi:hypothetical protein